jgi:hypothetical protein
MPPLTYPFCLLAEDLRIQPLADVSGTPFFLDLSDSGSAVDRLDPLDPDGFQRWLDDAMGTGYAWGIGNYLECRTKLLRHFPQMQEEGRCYHLGVDIVLPKGSPLYAPLPGKVAAAGYEKGQGNYGGYLLLAHDLPASERFYTFYGHLEPTLTAAAGTVLGAGETMARTGGFAENGNWFYHTHLQIITPLGLADGYDTRGYCTPEMLGHIRERCPDPAPLLCCSLGGFS